MPTPYRAASAAFVFSLTALLAACGNPQPEDARVRAPLVRTEIARPSDAAGRSFSGVVVARVQSDLGFRVSGKVIERLVDVGQAVRRGQPAMRIDATDLTLATLAQNSTVVAAQARADQTAADEKRYADLVAQGAVSASAYDQAKAASDAAQALLRAAKAQAGVLQNAVNYAVLLADTDGVVVETLAEPGQVVAAGQTVVRLAKSGAREALVNLPETVRPALGSEAHAAVFGQPDTVQAKLRQLSNSANPMTRTFEARYVLDGTAASAPLGSTVTVNVESGGAMAKAAVQVPLSALFDPGTGPGVWLVQGAPSKVVWHAVHVSALSQETATLTSGLKVGERYVSLGVHALHAGQEVRVGAGVQP